MTLAGQVAFAPGSPITSVAARLLMAGSVPRARRGGGDASRALASALWTTSAGRIPVEEQAWIRRIEARRQELPAATAAAFTPDGLELTRGEAEQRLAHASRGCRWISISPLWGRFLMRVVRELRPRSCLELGTGLGLSAAYQAAALQLNGKGTITTLDLARPWAEIAQEGLSSLDLDHLVRIRVGPIGDEIDAALAHATPVDFAFIDADHTEQATGRHLDAILPHLAPGAVVVIDDINWTGEMRRAWKAARSRDRVDLALSLRRLGIIVFSRRG